MRYLYFCKVGDFVIEIYYDWKVGSIINRFTYKLIGYEARNDHTIMTAPLPVCSAKLSIIRLG